MTNSIKELAAKVVSGGTPTREEALALFDAPPDELAARADALRARFRGDAFDLCAIVNARSGRCSENCKFCAQSSSARARIDVYPTLPIESILAAARRASDAGVARFSIVTSGRRFPKEELATLVAAIRAIRRETPLAVCASLGLLDADDFVALKEAGLSRYHCNLETSRRFFPQICSTHSYDEKLATLRAARSVGLSLCSGGIFGLGETLEDRVDMALTLRELDVDSVPINIFNAIPGVALAALAPLTSEDARRIVAVYRFILPRADIRLAGGRTLLDDSGFGCFASGSNATITGDMLTTSGIAAARDLRVVREMGYRIVAPGEGRLE